MKLKVIVLVFLFAVICSYALSYSAVPQMINYQGKITTPAGALVDTTVQMTFTIYDDSTGGNTLWADTVASVEVEKGIFSVLLGSVNPIPDSVFPGDVRYLGVKVGTDPEMTPTKQIVSVAYAYKSEYADTAKYAQVAVSDGDWTPDTAGINIYRLTGNVGIGTPSPAQKLHVAGNVQVDDTLFASNVSSNSPLRLQTAGTTRLYIDDASGNVGIGTTSPGDFKLNVQGDTDGIHGTGSTYGIYGSASGWQGWGVYGTSSDAAGAGLYGTGSGRGVVGHSNSTYGVHGYSVNSYGVYGESNSSRGVYGHCNGGTGVYGASNSGNGVYGESYYGNGVDGRSTDDEAVYGRSVNDDGVAGRSDNGIGVTANGQTYNFYASGPGTNYGPFTGGHEVKFSQDFPGIIKPGMVVSATGQAQVRTTDQGEISFSSTLPTVQLSDTPDDSKVLGVLISELPLDEDHWYISEVETGDRFGTVNALGEGRVWVTNINGDIKAGDYITTSSIAGYGQKQKDDLLHSYTLGKAIEDIDWSTVTETVEFNGKTYRVYPMAVIYTSG